jgi:hypothetical protein
MAGNKKPTAIGWRWVFLKKSGSKNQFIFIPPRKAEAQTTKRACIGQRLVSGRLA